MSFLKKKQDEQGVWLKLDLLKGNYTTLYKRGLRSRDIHCINLLS